MKYGPVAGTLMIDCTSEYIGIVEVLGLLVCGEHHRLNIERRRSPMS